MYINTHTKELMEFDILNYFNVTDSELMFLFKKAKTAAVKECYFDSAIFNNVIDEFVYTHTPSVPIDYVLFFHLTRRLNTVQSDFSGRNLADLLTTASVLSKFLRNYGVEFMSNDGHLDLYHCGNLISLENTGGVRESRVPVPYLRARLGYNRDREDYCFNGFLLKDRLYKNHYAYGLSDVPEFIENLATFLNRKDIRTKYHQNSTYFCLEYCIPLEKVLFDDNENLSLDEKRKHLLNQIMWRLYDYTDVDHCDASDHGNPILRLKDYDTMDSKYFVSRERITDEMLR